VTFHFTVPILPIAHPSCLHCLYLVRYGGTKLERARDLFEQCLEKLPPKEAPEFYIKARPTHPPMSLTINFCPPWMRLPITLSSP
jgi:hypothetical protein